MGTAECSPNLANRPTGGHFIGEQTMVDYVIRSGYMSAYSVQQMLHAPEWDENDGGCWMPLEVTNALANVAKTLDDFNHHHRRGAKRVTISITVDDIEK